MSETSTTIELNPGGAVPSNQERLAEAIPASWVLKGGAAVLDQVIFSGSHFVVGLLLARWLPAVEYGVFALAYSVLLFFLAVHSALLGEPMTLYGAARYRERFDDYTRGVLRAHWWLTLPASLALAVAGYLLESPRGRLRWPLWGLGLALPGVLLLWLVRRACYARLRPGLALLASAAYSGLLIALLALLPHFGLLSTSTVFVAMAVSAWVVSSANLSSLSRRTEGNSPVPFPGLIRDHWNYGCWAVAASGATWFTMNAYFLVLPATHGLEAAANLRALTNLVTPCLQAFVGIGMMLVPIFARRTETYGATRMLRDLRKIFFLMSAASLLYAALIWISRNTLFSFLYAWRYGKDAGPGFLLLLLLPFVGSFPLVAGAGLRALARPDLVFAAYGGAALAVALFGMPLAQLHGTAGAAMGLLLSEGVAGALCSFFLLRLRRES